MNPPLQTSPVTPRRVKRTDRANGPFLQARLGRCWRPICTWRRLNAALFWCRPRLAQGAVGFCAKVARPDSSRLVETTGPDTTGCGPRALARAGGIRRRRPVARTGSTRRSRDGRYRQAGFVTASRAWAEDRRARDRARMAEEEARVYAFRPFTTVECGRRAECARPGRPRSAVCAPPRQPRARAFNRSARSASRRCLPVGYPNSMRLAGNRAPRRRGTPERIFSAQGKGSPRERRWRVARRAMVSRV